MFRKLEQNTDKFGDQIRKMAETLGVDVDGVPTDDLIADRFGAMIVGRFTDGTPLALQATRGAAKPALNDFTYLDDSAGTKCPHSAHIRVMNPRIGSANTRPIIARRGQSYRYPENDEDPYTKKTRTNANKETKETKGLLFMGLVSNIETQFEMLQRRANGAVTNTGEVAVDQIIGQPGGGQLRLSAHWGGATLENPTACAFASCVTMRGGEYFFLPSIHFLRSL